MTTHFAWPATLCSVNGQQEQGEWHEVGSSTFNAIVSLTSVAEGLLLVTGLQAFSSVESDEATRKIERGE